MKKIDHDFVRALESTLLRLEAFAIMRSCWYEDKDERLVAEMMDMRFFSVVRILMAVDMRL